MNNDQAVVTLNDVAYTYSQEPDTDKNRAELITQLNEVIAMNDDYTTSQVESALREINDKGNYIAVLNSLLQWSEDALDEIMENQQ